MSTTEVVRRFNRTYTQRIGALQESFLGLGLPLGQARVLHEVGADRRGARVLDLRARLGLDSGHLARLLRSLEERGLAEVLPDPVDRRRRVVTLTPAGAALRGRLEERSEQLAARLVAPLTPRQQERLSSALATADLLVRAATVELVETDPRSAPARDAVRRYLHELDARFPDGFDVAAAEAEDAAAPPAPVAHPPGRFVLALSDGAPVACGGLRTVDAGVAEVKRMWVDPGWRGAGLGARVLRHLEELALETGHRVVRLDTHGSLAEAVAMYERAGYRRIERYNDNPHAQVFFERRLTSWETTRAAPPSAGAR